MPYYDEIAQYGGLEISRKDFFPKWKELREKNVFGGARSPADDNRAIDLMKDMVLRGEAPLNSI